MRSQGLKGTSLEYTDLTEQGHKGHDPKGQGHGDPLDDLRKRRRAELLSLIYEDVKKVTRAPVGTGFPDGRVTELIPPRVVKPGPSFQNPIYFRPRGFSESDASDCYGSFRPDLSRTRKSDSYAIYAEIDDVISDTPILTPPPGFGSWSFDHKMNSDDVFGLTAPPENLQLLRSSSSSPPKLDAASTRRSDQTTAVRSVDCSRGCSREDESFHIWRSPTDVLQMDIQQPASASRPRGEVDRASVRHRHISSSTSCERDGELDYRTSADLGQMEESGAPMSGRVSGEDVFSSQRPCSGSESGGVNERTGIGVTDTSCLDLGTFATPSAHTPRAGHNPSNGSAGKSGKRKKSSEAVGRRPDNKGDSCGRAAVATTEDKRFRETEKLVTDSPDNRSSCSGEQYSKTVENSLNSAEDNHLSESVRNTVERSEDGSEDRLEETSERHPTVSRSRDLNGEGEGRSKKGSDDSGGGQVSVTKNDNSAMCLASNCQHKNGGGVALQAYTFTSWDHVGKWPDSNLPPPPYEPDYTLPRGNFVPLIRFKKLPGTFREDGRDGNYNLTTPSSAVRDLAWYEGEDVETDDAALEELVVREDGVDESSPISLPERSRISLRDTAIQTSLDLDGYAVDISKTLDVRTNGFSKTDLGSEMVQGTGDIGQGNDPPGLAQDIGTGGIQENEKERREEEGGKVKEGKEEDGDNVRDVDDKEEGKVKIDEGKGEIFDRARETEVGSAGDVPDDQGEEESDPTRTKVRRTHKPVTLRSKSLHNQKDNVEGRSLKPEATSLSGSLRELSHLNIDVSQKLVAGQRHYVVENGSADLQVVVNALTPVLSRRNRSRAARRLGHRVTPPDSPAHNDDRRQLNHHQYSSDKTITETQQSAGTKSAPEVNEVMKVQSTERKSTSGAQGASDRPGNDQAVFAAARAGVLGQRNVHGFGRAEEKREDMHVPMYTRLRSHDGTYRPGEGSAEQESTTAALPRLPKRDRKPLYQISDKLSQISKGGKGSEKPREPHREKTREKNGGSSGNREKSPSDDAWKGLDLSSVIEEDSLSKELETSKKSMFLSPKLAHTWHGVSDCAPTRTAPRMGVGVITGDTSRLFSSHHGMQGTGPELPSAPPSRHVTRTLPVISRTLLDALHKRYCAHQYSQHYSVLQPFPLLKRDPAFPTRTQPITALRVEPRPAREHEVVAAPPSPQVLARMRKLQSDGESDTTSSATDSVQSSPRQEHLEEVPAASSLLVQPQRQHSSTDSQSHSSLRLLADTPASLHPPEAGPGGSHSAGEEPSTSRASPAPPLPPRDSPRSSSRRHFLDVRSWSLTPDSSPRQKRLNSGGKQAELEAVEALKWLKAAGFPQYAQMFQDGQFPVELWSVERDHDFLDKDSLQSLFRRLDTLNKYAGMKIDAQSRKKAASEDEEEDDLCALSERWEYQKSVRRWSRKDLHSPTPAPPSAEEADVTEVIDRSASHDSLLADQDSGSQTGDSPLLHPRTAHSSAASGGGVASEETSSRQQQQQQQQW
ncbi:uncharacterized protein LOC106014037 [Aplysia californica]|uniref:Uncharacterized protein LOC106014037 n=1 Tax=Aplysia californica TaxID=6500 RepID=A0ABM1AF66_APLCA|nr:uncharacterized protein LOC106014037 [Aplysia californica]